MNKLCVNCANLIRKEPPSSPRYDVWYNLLCKATPLQEVVDPTTGKKGYAQANDLGRKIVTNNPYEYCREVNMDGNCPKFYPKD
jgi:hypothetical protein